MLVLINPLLDDDAEVDLKRARKIFAKTEIGEDRMEIEF